MRVSVELLGWSVELTASPCVDDEPTHDVELSADVERAEPVELHALGFGSSLPDRSEVFWEESTRRTPVPSVFLPTDFLNDPENRREPARSDITARMERMP